MMHAVVVLTDDTAWRYRLRDQQYEDMKDMQEKQQAHLVDMKRKHSEKIEELQSQHKKKVGAAVFCHPGPFCVTVLD